jgi:hypothetical protein
MPNWGINVENSYNETPTPQVLEKYRKLRDATEKW